MLPLMPPFRFALFMRAIIADAAAIFADIIRCCCFTLFSLRFITLTLPILRHFVADHGDTVSGERRFCDSGELL
jgi:hypothetical protein